MAHNHCTDGNCR